MRANGQVQALCRRVQVGARGGHAPAALCGDLVHPHAVWHRAVESRIAREARVGARIQKRLAQRMNFARHIAHVQWPAVATPGRIAMRRVFHLLEVGQHVAPPPARVAQGLPVVKVLRQATHVDHRVDRTRAAQHLAAWPVTLAPAQTRLGNAAVHPVQRRVVERQAVADRHLHAQALVAAAGFQQEHAVPAACAQAVREHAAGRTGADDDVVKRVAHARTRGVA